jgi:glycosyltransferase involved in cell wall biosynthesis
MKTPSPPLHVGILCDYGFTYQPNEGIGVFVYNLVDGLLTLPAPPRITLQIRPGDAHWLRDQTKAWGGRVRLYPRGRLTLARAAWAVCAGIAWAHRRQAHALHHFTSRVANAGMAFLRNQWLALRDRRRHPAARAARAALLALAAAALAPAAWALGAAYYLFTQFLLPVLGYPHRYAAQVYFFFANREKLPPFAPAPGVDVWLVPLPRTDARLNAPEVLVVFDLIHHHMPGVFSEEMSERTDRLLTQRARRAAVIYCASENVRVNDLERFLPFARDRIRTFGLAPPPDGGHLEVPRAEALRVKYGLGKRFLYYPAAFRPYKNHRQLLRAFQELRKDEDYHDLVLIFTGPETASAEIRDLVLEVEEEEGALLPYVRLPGIVPRGDVVGLYRHAAAVVVPTLFEGYGLPVMEALRQGALLCCSDIPAFHELLGDHFGCVESFDPHDPADIRRAVARTLADGERLSALQARAFEEVGRRTWTDVAADFMELFEEAAAGPRAPRHPETEVIAHA